jgi:hypothetical protein
MPPNSFNPNYPSTFGTSQVNKKNKYGNASKADNNLLSIYGPGGSSSSSNSANSYNKYGPGTSHSIYGPVASSSKYGPGDDFASAHSPTKTHQQKGKHQHFQEKRFNMKPSVDVSTNYETLDMQTEKIREREKSTSMPQKRVPTSHHNDEKLGTSAPGAPVINQASIPLLQKLASMLKNVKK